MPLQVQGAAELSLLVFVLTETGKTSEELPSLCVFCRKGATVMTCEKEEYGGYLI